MNTAPNSVNRRPFYLVLTVFFAPLLVAFALYYGSGWRPAGGTNKGELITPAIPLPPLSGNEQVMRQVWTLVYVGAGQCDQLCRQALSNMQVARQLLGKDLPRTGRVFLYSGALAADMHTFAPGVMMVSTDNATAQAVLAALPRRNGQSPLQAPRIYLVDPLGNLMMSYAADADPRDLYLDLKKLLKLSHIG